MAQIRLWTSTPVEINVSSQNNYNSDRKFFKFFCILVERLGNGANHIEYLRVWRIGLGCKAVRRWRDQRSPDLWAQANIGRVTEFLNCIYVSKLEADATRAGLEAIAKWLRSWGLIRGAVREAAFQQCPK